MGIPDISITYQTAVRDRPISSIGIRAAAGDPRRGWLTADGRTIPVALGRGGIRANKREGDGGTPKGTFRPAANMVARRPPSAAAHVSAGSRRSGPRMPGARIPQDRHYNRPVRLAARAGRRPADARRSPLRFHRRDRSQPSPRIAGRGSAVFLHLARDNFGPTAGCVSMTKSAMLRLLRRLGPETRIVIG